MREVYVYNFLDRMATGKQNAMNRSNRGFSGGKAGTVIWHAASYAPREDSHGEAIAAMHSAWQAVKSDAIDAFRFACHGDDWAEGFPL